MGRNRCCSSIGVHMARQLPKKRLGVYQRGGTGGARLGLMFFYFSFKLGKNQNDLSTWQVIAGRCNSSGPRSGQRTGHQLRQVCDLQDASGENSLLEIVFIEQKRYVTHILIKDCILAKTNQSFATCCRDLSTVKTVQLILDTNKFEVITGSRQLLGKLRSYQDKQPILSEISMVTT